MIGRSEPLLEPGATEPWWWKESPSGVKGVPAAERMYPMTVLARRAVFDAIGLFDEGFRIGEDVDWLFRAWEAGLEIATLDTVVQFRRVHDANVTGDYAAARTAMFRVLKARADRMRAAGAQAER